MTQPYKVISVSGDRSKDIVVELAELERLSRDRILSVFTIPDFERKDVFGANLVTGRWNFYFAYLPGGQRIVAYEKLPDKKTPEELAAEHAALEASA